MVPRLLRLHPSTYQRLARLSKEAERDGAYRVAKRLRAVVLNSEGHTSGELAEVLQAPRSKVSEWLAENTVYIRCGSSTDTAKPDEIANMGEAREARKADLAPRIVMEK